MEGKIILIENRARTATTAASATEHPWPESAERFGFSKFAIDALESGDLVSRDDASFFLENADV